MAYTNILVAYDGSEASKNALDAALEFVDYQLTERVYILSVIDPHKVEDPTLEIAARMSNVQEVALDTEHYLAETSKELAPLIVGFEGLVEIIVKIGKPHDEIIKVAEEKNCDLIIMGSRGLGAIRGMLGSVSFAVLRDAEIPVLVSK